MTNQTMLPYLSLALMSLVLVGACGDAGPNDDTRLWAAALEGEPVLDQEQPLFDGQAPTLAVGGEDVEGEVRDQEVAQVVTAGLDGPLTQVELITGCSVDGLWVEIRGLSDGHPGDDVWASEFVTPPEPVSEYRIVFSEPATVTAGTSFAIVLTSEGTCGVGQGPLGDSYPDGEVWYREDVDGSPWFENVPERDLYFATYVGGADGESVTICHHPPGNPDNAHTIRVGAAALDAHLANHSDTLGPCESGDDS